MKEIEFSHRLMVELGRSQFGVVARRQLITAGFGRGLIEYHLKSGLLWPVFRGAYVIGRPVELQKSIWMAATLAGGPGSVLAGLSVGEYWGILSHRNLVQVNRPRARTRVMTGQLTDSRRIHLYLRTRHCPPELTVCPEGIPVLTVPAALVELAAVLNDRQMEAAVAEASRLGYLDVEIVSEITRLGFGRTGSARLRKALRWWTPETANVLSVLEAMFLRLCEEHSIEKPMVNRTVCGLKVDFVWPKQMVVVETDGFTFHGDLVSFKRDHQRQSILARGGYLRLSFTYWQVTETPDEVIEAVLVGLKTWRSGAPK